MPALLQNSGGLGANKHRPFVLSNERLFLLHLAWFKALALPLRVELLEALGSLRGHATTGSLPDGYIFELVKLGEGNLQVVR